jgi:hypothetical protein
MQGLWWPIRLAAVLRQNYDTGLVLNMPNLHGLYHESWQIEAISCAGVILCTAIIARAGRTDVALSGSLAAGVLIAPHAYLQDVALLIPLILLVVQESSWLIRLLGFVISCPLPIGLVLANDPRGVKVLAASNLCFLILVTLDISGNRRTNPVLTAGTEPV